jgi:hypothetical protein
MSRFAPRTLAAAILVTTLAVASTAAFERYLSRVSAGHSDTWTRTLGSGYHRVVVDGDDDTDLDLFVYDASGNVLAYDNDATDYCVVRWYQSYRGTVRIVIFNLGSVYNEYELTIE